MNKAYKFKIKPNKEQITFFAKSFGCCRKYWNENINLLLPIIDIYEKEVEELKKKAKEDNLKFKRPKFNWFAIYPSKMKKQFPFLNEIDSLALSNEQLRLNLAVKDYLKGKCEKPKFHLKNKDKNSYITNNIKIDGKFLILPKVRKVRLVQHRKIEGKIKNATISLEPNGKYYISIITELESIKIENVKPVKAIGFDYSSPLTWVDSEGYSPNCRFYRDNLKKIQKNDRELSRKKLHSNNWYKQLKKNNKLHIKIKNRRKDLLYKESKNYVDSYDLLVFEDLDLRGISKALHLGKSTLDNGFGMFRTFIEYKAKNQGKYFIKVNKNNTTQTCSNCGKVKEKEEKLVLGIKTYTCKHCGISLDRDINAAINIKNRGWDYLDSLLNNESMDLCSQETSTFK